MSMENHELGSVFAVKYIKDWIRVCVEINSAMCYNDSNQREKRDNMSTFKRILAMVPALVLSVAVTALISGLTIGGKAVGKNIAITQSTKVVYMAGRVIHVFRSVGR